MIDEAKRWSSLALPVILLLALALRLWGIGFGLPFANARPDETAVAGPAVHMLSGDLRPANFNKPTLFVYSVSAAYLAYYAVTAPASHLTLGEFAETRRQNIAPFLYISRLLSALLGVCTVWWLYGLARAVTGDETIALLSATFMAVAFLPVRDAHFGVTDVPLTAFIVLSVRAVVAWRRHGGWRRAVIAGLVGGVAMSVKYNGLGLVAPFMVAAIIRWRESAPGATARQLSGETSAFAAAFAAAFLAGSPFVLIEWPRFVQDVSVQSVTLTTGHGMATIRGWWYHAIVTLPQALGWPLFLTSVAGVAALLMLEFTNGLLLMAFPIAYYLVAGHGYTVFARYMLPVLPFLCVTAAWALVRGSQRAFPSRPLPVMLLAAFVVAAPSAVRAAHTDYLLSQVDNRVVVSEALATMVSADHSIYQSGASYGRVQLPVNCRHEVTERDPAKVFGAGALPDWVLLQQSPLELYSPVPDVLIAALAQHYEKFRTFPVADERARLYDQQDAFFLPLSDLSGVVRPGPAFDLYRLKR